MKNDIANNLKELHDRMSLACAKGGREPNEITIIAVTKGHPANVITEAAKAGFSDVGENRIQEAEWKIRELGAIARWHMIGHLQTNKVKKAVELFDVIQSVDSFRLALEINKRASEIGRVIECYIEVNSSGEPQKSGVAPTEAVNLIKEILPLSNIKLSGLMTVGPLTDNTDDIRKAFILCHDLFKKGQEILGHQFCNLSMGMSDDFELAIAEGSTMIRIGSSIFGTRDQNQ